MMAGRSSFLVKLARKVQLLPLRCLQFIELPFIAKYRCDATVTPAIFILALPRSGSTVAYQSVCHGLEVGYLSNLWNILYQLPLVGGWLSAKKAQAYSSDFMSQNGFVAGLNGPAEGLCFWKWWLDCGLSDADCSNLSLAKLKKRKSYLRRVFARLASSGKPFATAYLGHSLVPDRVAESFPGAVLVRLKREPVSNALSLLNARRLSRSDWFSVKPHECDTSSELTVHAQVSAQVYWLNRRLDDAEFAYKMFTVHYEDLCANPEREIERIRKHCGSEGLSIARKFTLPRTFPFKKADLIRDPDARAIQAAFVELEEKFGKLENI